MNWAASEGELHTLLKDCKKVKVKAKQSRYRPEVSIGFQEVKVPRLRDNGSGWW